jgi:hypothetical protein
MATIYGTTCECCGENEVWASAAEHGFQYCEKCTMIQPMCSRRGCDREVEGENIPVWAEMAERCVNSIVEALNELGVDYELDQSSLSEAHYITVQLDDEDLKIRVADHAPRPSYEHLHGTADYEVCITPTSHPAADGGVDDCIVWLRRKLAE